MSLKKRGLLAASVAALALATTSLVGCSAPAADDATVKIGVVPGGQPYWTTFVDAAAEEGITVKIVDFDDYPQPNPALTEGELDLNQFQHIQYLAEHNVASGDDLGIIGSTFIYPMNIFSAKYKSLDEIPAGGTIAVPDDPSNGARALLVLQKFGLIELKDGGSNTSTADDVIAEKSKVKVQTLAADLIPSSLPDVDAGVVNNDYVEPAGLDFKDSLGADGVEDESVQPYINIFAARTDDLDNETYNKLVDIYQNNADVQAALKDYVGDGAVAVKLSKSELAKILKTAEDDVRASQK